MSLATRCPACGTTFRVVRDQLRISDGWVRCGRCSHVFDGAAELHDPLSDPLPVTAPAVPAAETPAAPSAGIDFFSDALSRLQADGPAPAQRAPAEPSAWPSLDIPAPAWPASPVREDPTLDEVAELEEEPVPMSALALPVPPDDGWARLPSLQWDAAPMAAAVTAPPPDLQEAEIEDAGPSALRQSRLAALQAARAHRAAEAERPRAIDDEAITLALTPSEPLAGDATGVPVFGIARSFRANPGAQPMRPPSRWWPRLLRGFVLLALVLLLLAQVLYQQRDAIVARQPALQPWFAGLCERLGCQLSALRRIADVTIDGASFLREKEGEGYQFSFTLRNRAAIPLAMPAVELSLLDLEERVVVRRVLRPAEYGAPAVLAAHAERMTQLPIVLVGEDASSASRVAGFRLDAFYP